MISLKKYLDMEAEKPATAEASTRELLPAALDCYRAALLAMGIAGVQANPGVGAELQKSLVEHGKRLSSGVTTVVLQETQKKVEEELNRWGTRSAEDLQGKAQDVKELLVALARTAQSVGERDKRYTGQFTAFTNRLQTIANLEDLTQIRASLVQGASELKSYVDRMTQDNQSLVNQLQTEVSTYESKLKATEELALRDELTDLPNRRNVENRIESRIAKGEPFCVVVLDLNHFKEINDTHGHLAGDHLLKQFATELRTSARSTDTVGRWGGDEFVMVLECGLPEAQLQLERTKKWLFGEYKIQPGPGAAEIKAGVSASLGVAQWQPGETIKEVLNHADSAMYADKEAARKQKR